MRRAVIVSSLCAGLLALPVAPAAAYGGIRPEPGPPGALVAVAVLVVVSVILLAFWIEIATRVRGGGSRQARSSDTKSND
jgi:hypothetical protein